MLQNNYILGALYSMKRYLSFLLAFIMIMALPIDGFAAKKSEMEYIQIIDGMTNEEYEVKIVNVMMGGRDVISDVPAILLNDRTLVPVRFITENLGAEVTWVQETKEAIIKTEKKEIILKIDSPKVYVNNEEQTLPDGVPAKLIGYQDNFRTMVPLRFVSEQLGMEVGWIGETMTATINKPLQNVTDIGFDNTSKFFKILINTTGEVETSSFFLKGSDVGGEDRLVIDIPNTKLNISNSNIVDEKGLVNVDVYEGGIKSIRASQFEVDPYTTRIVVDLDKIRGHEIKYNEESNQVEVTFINIVDEIKLDTIHGVDTVVIETAQEMPDYNVMYLDNKLVVDVINSVLKYDGEKIGPNGRGLKEVRFSQFSPDKNYDPDDLISRVVIEIEDYMSLENLYIENVDNNILVYVDGNPFDGIEYVKTDVNVASIKVNTMDIPEYTKEYDKKDNEISIKVPKDSVDLEELDIDIDDNIVKNIKVDDKGSSDYFYIDVKLTEGTVYTDESENLGTNQIVFNFNNKKIEESKYKDKLIVIDPGHGGNDPGAISPNLKLKEKDIVLDVSLKLKKLLEKEGFKVYMTRDDDNYIGLYDRTDIANELGADVFVSIHANANDNRDVEGIQVLYYPDDPTRDNKTFANVMMDALVKGLDAQDKGIIPRPNLVVPRETKMPAVLLELGFLTNSKEEQLLNMSEYRDKAAEASLNGIIEYFNKYIMK